MSNQPTSDTQYAVRMSEIDEPPLPIRTQMDEEQMKDLALSMSEIGQLIPIIVVCDGGRLKIVDGHRRFLAARSMGWEWILANVREETAEDRAAIMLHANLMREDVSVADEAIWVAQMHDEWSWDEDRICRAVRRSAEWVGERYKLLAGDADVFTALRERKISFAVAKQLNRITDQPMRYMHLHQCIAHGYPAHVVAQWVTQANSYGATPIPGPSTSVVTEMPQPAQSREATCCMCGGDRDPYNLRPVSIHYYCLERLQSVMHAQEERREKT